VRVVDDVRRDEAEVELVAADAPQVVDRGTGLDDRALDAGHLGVDQLRQRDEVAVLARRRRRGADQQFLLRGERRGENDGGACGERHGEEFRFAFHVEVSSLSESRSSRGTRTSIESTRNEWVFPCPSRLSASSTPPSRT